MFSSRILTAQRKKVLQFLQRNQASFFNTNFFKEGKETVLHGASFIYGLLRNDVNAILQNIPQ